jgi:hypothetical protein
MAAALRASGVPAVGFLHELAPAWRGRGWRGAAQAAAQRAALRPLLGALAAAIVTAEERVAELRRPWLPKRPVEFIPLVSNVVPIGAAGQSRPADRLRVGLFGFRHATLDADLVTRALAGLDSATLILVGEPGPRSAEAARWRAAANANGAAIEFTGALEPAGLSRALDDVDVVVSPDPPGPAPRRGTLAAALAHGRPVLALDGPRTWRPFVDEGALVVAGPRDFGARLNELAADPELRRAYGDRASAFYDRHMRPQIVAPRLRQILEAAGV